MKIAQKETKMFISKSCELLVSLSFAKMIFELYMQTQLCR